MNIVAIMLGNLGGDQGSRAICIICCSELFNSKRFVLPADESAEQLSLRVHLRTVDAVLTRSDVRQLVVDNDGASDTLSKAVDIIFDNAVAGSVCIPVNEPGFSVGVPLAKATTAPRPLLEVLTRDMTSRRPDSDLRLNA